MRNITINLPDQYYEAIQVLTDLDIFPSRSETIRLAIKGLLDHEFQFSFELKTENFKKKVVNVRKCKKII